MNWLDLGWPLLMWSILAAAGGGVCAALWWYYPDVRHRLLLLTRQRHVSWTGFDVLAVLLISQLVPVAIYQGLRTLGVFQLPGDSESIPGPDILWTQVLSLPVQVGLIVSGLWLSRGVWPARLGLTGRRLAPNLVAGYLVWLVVTPILLVLYFVLLQFIPEPPHPFLNMDIPSVWLLLLFGVSIAAPVVEELIFRGVLLPWTLNAPLEHQVLVGVGALLLAFVNGCKKAEFNPAPVDFVLVMLPGFLLLPHLLLRRLPDRNGESNAEPNGEPSLLARLLASARRPEARPLLAIYANGLLFGAVHSMWPAPIPLMVLGMALAWLAYRTQSLVGPILVHGLFNGVTFLTLVWPQPTQPLFPG